MLLKTVHDVPALSLWGSKIWSTSAGEMTRAFVQVGILGYVLTFLIMLFKSLIRLSLSNKSFILCLLSRLFELLSELDGVLQMMQA
jgi:hypothetical protein